MEKEFGEYKVDITKPPIGPPCREIRVSIFSRDVETPDSKERNKQWQLYRKAYRECLKRYRNK